MIIFKQEEAQDNSLAGKVKSKLLSDQSKIVKISMGLAIMSLGAGILISNLTTSNSKRNISILTGGGFGIAFLFTAGILSYLQKKTKIQTSLEVKPFLDSQNQDYSTFSSEP